jgi:hypothetical protein
VSCHNVSCAPLPAALSIEEGAACFIVRDHDKQALAYVSGGSAPTKLRSKEWLH